MSSTDSRRDALIGSTGFVGSNLLQKRTFGSLYNSANIVEIAGNRFRTLVCAAPGAEKWKANLDPERDRQAVQQIRQRLESVEAEKVILISTVDVYPNPHGVDEDSVIDIERCSAYGRHRLELERWVAERFNSLVVRLPGLFGPGLKTNALYDLLNDHRVDAIDSRAVYQFYDVTRLANDLATAGGAGLSLLNIAIEPIGIELVAREIFQRTLTRTEGSSPPAYDFRTGHAAIFGGANGYLQSADDVLADMRQWVNRERRQSQ